MFRRGGFSGLLIGIGSGFFFGVVLERGMMCVEGCVYVG